MTGLAWPKKGDKLFRQDSAPHGLFFQLGSRRFYGGDPWTIYASAYRKSAEILVQQLLTSRNVPDYVVLPAVFNFRHYLELQLKALILQTQTLLDETPKVANEHRLETLWAELEKRAGRVSPDFKGQEVAAVKACVRELAGLDHGSDAFRYPVNKKGDDSHDRRDFDLAAFSRTMAAVGNFLDSLGDHFASLAEDKYEAEAWYREEEALCRAEKQALYRAEEASCHAEDFCGESCERRSET